MKKYPFLPMSVESGLKISKPFRNFAKPFLRFFPELKIGIDNMELKLTEEEYSSLAVLSSAIMSVFGFVAVLIFTVNRLAIQDCIISALLAGLLFFVMDFISQMYYPQIILSNRAKLLDKDLLFAMRYVLIKLKSGVSLYDAMVGVSVGEYGEVSREFKKAVKEIATGTDETVALENMALRNPAPFFRRVIWQITSNVKAGADIADVLDSITSTIVKEQKIMIHKYGSELNPLIMMYMMLSVVVPSLGVTVVVVMSSFSGIKVPVYIFYLIPAYVFFTQIIFMRLIKTKKPMLSL